MIAIGEDDIIVEAADIQEPAPTSIVTRRVTELLASDPKQRIIKSVIGIVSEDHLQSCDCQKERIEKIQKKLMAQTYEELEAKGRAHDTTLLKRRFYADKQQGIMDAAELCAEQGVFCPYEYAELEQTLDRFMEGERYDFQDPRAYMIIRTVLNHQISVLRMQLYSNKHGVTARVFDRQGNMHHIVNPVEDLKRKFDESIVKAISELDKIFEGTKLNVRGTMVTVPVEEIFGAPKATEERDEEEVVYLKEID